MTEAQRELLLVNIANIKFDLEKLRRLFRAAGDDIQKIRRGEVVKEPDLAKHEADFEAADLTVLALDEFVEIVKRVVVLAPPDREGRVGPSTSEAH